MKTALSFISAVVAAVMTASAADFTASDITVDNKKQHVTLGATITRPVDAPPRAALVLATGSGAQNRDEELLGHKPFKTIAEHLSSNGYAVLRFDDRGVGESTGDAASMTTDDYVADITSCLDYLTATFGDGVPTGVLGHSQGGSAAIKLGSDTSVCDFILTIGAPAWPGDSIIMSQARAMTTAMTGKWDGEPLQRRLLDMVRSDVSSLMLSPMLYAEVARTLGEMAKMPEVQQQLMAQTSAMCSTAYRDLVKYDPTADIKAVTVPWLALNGSHDMQVLPENLATIEQLNPAADTRLLDKHNHLLQRCSTGMVQEYASISEDISPDALAVILAWLDSLQLKH
ncbi:MAG: alpha/beta hydrolase [Muribaculaceae bacterium]|nr:alpha/beta hydrolase [Muribaculaceae bacterium]